jgi:hypothetical protein
MTGNWGAIARALDDVVRFGRPARLLIAGRGTISVYPSQDVVVTDVRDWESLPPTGEVGVRLEPGVWASPPASALSLTHLRWRAAVNALAGERAADGRVSHELLQLQSWPDLPQLPLEFLAPVTRICALLWRKPTVGYLVPRIVGLELEETMVLLHVLRGFGHVSGAAAPDAKPVQGVGAAAAAEQRESEAAEVPTVVTKLWQRLLGLQPA